jgi:non-specific serine/threonine protein kinase
VLIHEERDGRLQVRLTDFGIGELLDTGKAIDLNMSVTVFVEPLAKTESYNSMSGTRLYMAPELLTGEQASTRTDVFALGVLLFQVVVGDLKRSVAHGWEQYVDDEILRDDIAACIAGTPSDRLASPAILSERLRTLDRRRQERETERRAAVGNARRQRLLRVTTIATLLFMLVAGITGTLLWRSEQARRDAVEETRRATIAMEQALADSEWARRRLEQQLHKSEP